MKLLLIISLIYLNFSCNNNERDNPLDSKGINWNPPSLIAMSNVSVNINDSIYLNVIASDNGVINKYIWSINNTIFTDTTLVDTLKTAFSQLGINQVFVKVLDNDGVESNIVTIEINVTLDPPSLIAMSNVSVNINDSIYLNVTASDNGIINKYIWAINDTIFTDTTLVDTLKTAFLESGINQVFVKVLDDDGVESNIDTIEVNVSLDAPLITLIKDTIVSHSVITTLKVSVVAEDTNKGGSIEKYYWDIGLDGWDDSSNTPFYYVTSIRGGITTLAWSVRDDDNIMTSDTLSIYFNRHPNVELITVPTNSNDWIEYNSTLNNGTLPILFNANDPDGILDTLTYIFYTGVHKDSLTKSYNGLNNYYNLPNLDSNSTIYYRIVVRDLYGDSVFLVDSFITPSELLISKGGMKLIPSGTFNMGSTIYLNEKPIHKVDISSFYMDSTEVTQKKYSQVMSFIYDNYVSPVWQTKYGMGSNYPAYYVNWYDAILYCNAISILDSLDTIYSYTAVSGDLGSDCELSDLSFDLNKNGYRLPTEAEWEYACRAGSSSEYYWDIKKIIDYAWYDSNSENKSHLVAEKLPNDFGLYDINGNLFEWCNDWYDATYYAKSLTLNPTGPDNGDYRVVRGGAWNKDSLGLYSSRRFYFNDNYEFSTIGFRVVRLAD